MELLALLILFGILAFYVTLPSKKDPVERPLWPHGWDPYTPSQPRITEPSGRPWGSHGRTAQGVHHL